MAKINFVPTDYIQQRESGKVNLIYLLLFGLLMGAIAVTFSAIKMRQRVVSSELAHIEAKMAQAGTQIARLEELKIKTDTMVKQMAVIAELLEPVPRSIILASLTNSLPRGVSLLELKLKENEIKAGTATTAGASQYQKAAAQAKQQNAATALPQRPQTETIIEIRGIAPSDIEVAKYIARLNVDVLMDNVALIQSKEHTIDESQFREFKLRAKLKRNIQLTRETVDKIRQGRDSDT